MGGGRGAEGFVSGARQRRGQGREGGQGGADKRFSGCH